MITLQYLKMTGGGDTMTWLQLILAKWENKTKQKRLGNYSCSRYTAAPRPSDATVWSWTKVWTWTLANLTKVQFKVKKLVKLDLKSGSAM